MIARLHGLPTTAAKARTGELLERFDLSATGNKPASTYSGGMRRRLDLAASLVVKPPVLFLDEPTTGLDPRSRLGMWDIITKLVADGTTVLLTTQYLEEADQLADSIAVIDNGKVIAEGTSDELKASIGGQRVEINLVSDKDTKSAIAVLKKFGKNEPVVSTDGRSLTVASDDAPAALQQILAAFGAAGTQLFDAGMRRPTLDDVFLRLTGHTASEDEELDAGTASDKHSAIEEKAAKK